MSIPGPRLRAPALDSTREGVDAMGRGRQKAKQTKVARELKYYSPNTDYSALQSELGKSTGTRAVVNPEVEGDDVEETEDDGYADRYGRYGG